MKICVFSQTAQNRMEYEFINECLQPGLSTLGDQVVVSDRSFEDCDVACIMWSPRRANTDRARAARRIRHLTSQNLLIVETPVIRSVQSWYFRVGFDHVHKAGRFSGSGASTDRFKALGITLRPWRLDAEWIIIASQLPDDYSLDGLDIFEWTLDVATYLQKTSRRPIAIRPHPQDRINDWRNVGEALHMEWSLNSLADDLARAGTWVSYTSGSSVDAVIAGVPSITLSPNSFAWDVSRKSLADIDRPWIGEREPWLAALVNTQWTSAEIQNGDCWRNLRPLANDPRDL